MANLYVNGIPDGMDENGFRQLFEQHGQVISVKFVPDKKYGFVKFADWNVAEKAMHQLQGYSQNGATLNIRWANSDISGGPGGGPGDGFGPGSPSDNLYIKGLPPNITEDDIRQIFNQYGAITSCKILQTNAIAADPAGESIILMRMANVDQAKWIVDNLNGSMPQGLQKTITVKYAADKNQKGGDKGFGKGGFGPWGGEKGGFKGGDRFDPYGGGYGGDFGHGFGKGKGKDFGKGKGSFGNMWQSHSKAMVDMLANHGRYPAQKLPDGTDPTDLYIKGLPQDATELYLYKVFSPFGAIESAHAMVNPDGHLSGVAFLKFARPEDADLARNIVGNNPLPDGCHLSVTVKRPKGASGQEWGPGGDNYGPPQHQHHQPPPPPHYPPQHQQFPPQNQQFPQHHQQQFPPQPPHQQHQQHHDQHHQQQSFGGPAANYGAMPPPSQMDAPAFGQPQGFQNSGFGHPGMPDHGGMPPQHGMPDHGGFAQPHGFTEGGGFGHPGGF